jgi:Flp pilus assembly pilin Flp
LAQFFQVAPNQHIGAFMKMSVKKSGQSMMEYMILSALIGVVCLGIVKQFGKSIKERIQDMKEKINQEITIR